MVEDLGVFLCGDWLGVKKIRVSTVASCKECSDGWW